MTTCKKCDNQGTILLRKKDTYCENCFITNINHKFRACIGKSKILPAKEKVLICLSGGISSTALLDFIQTGLSLDNHKKLWICPIFLHITGGKTEAVDIAITKLITEHCNKYNFKVHVAHISEYMLINNDNMGHISPQVKSDAKNNFESLITNMPISLKHDFLQKVMRTLFIYHGKIMHCKYIFTAETAETLAINLLSNLSNGRGSQVQYDIGFCDNRDEVKILRPMRDITQEELQHFIKIKQLELFNSYETNKENSIHSVITNFVTDLQKNFQSTISTVCKTADKIGIFDADEYKKKCILCESGIQEQEHVLSALDATDYSRTISLGHPKNTNNKNDEKYSPMFPLVNECLCYTCSRIFSKMDKTRLPTHLTEKFDIS